MNNLKKLLGAESGIIRDLDRYSVNSSDDLCVMLMKQNKEGDTCHGSLRDDISSCDYQLGG